MRQSVRVARPTVVVRIGEHVRIITRLDSDAAYLIGITAAVRHNEVCRAGVERKPSHLVGLGVLLDSAAFALPEPLAEGDYADGIQREIVPVFTLVVIPHDGPSTFGAPQLEAIPAE